VDLTLRQNASIFATETQVKRLEEILKPTRTSTTSAAMSAAVRSASS